MSRTGVRQNPVTTGHSSQGNFDAQEMENGGDDNPDQRAFLWQHLGMLARPKRFQHLERLRIVSL
jgi:hypothetical protein